MMFNNKKKRKWDKESKESIFSIDLFCVSIILHPFCYKF